MAETITEIKTNIKRETLRLMFAVDKASGDYSSIKGVEDYNDKMDGAIDRAVVRICQANKVKTKTYDILVKIQENNESDADFEARDGFDMDSIDNGINMPSNFMQIDKVIFRQANKKVVTSDGITYRYNPIQNFNDYIMLDYSTILIGTDVSDGDKYTVYYHPSKVELTDLREDVIAIIPYFVKSEIYEEDEPTMAVKARNMFEQQLMAIEMNPQTVQTQVINIFGGLN